MPDDSGKFLKKANLISFWIKDYCKMIAFENNFKPSKNIAYKRGDIVKVAFGFNIGSEEGGLHYAVVIDKENPHNSPVVTVVPLSSMKQGKKLHVSEVSLGNELYKLLKTKHATINKEIQNRQKNNNELYDLVSAISCAEVIKLPSNENEQESYVTPGEKFKSNLANIKNSLEQEREEISKRKEKLDDIAIEISKMKEGSIAVINQITTISKIRILDPKATSDVLTGIRLPSESMDLINEKIKSAYIF